MSYEPVHVMQSRDVHVKVQNGASFPNDPTGVAPFHFSNQNNLGNEFERSPLFSGDILDYNPGRKIQIAYQDTGTPS